MNRDEQFLQKAKKMGGYDRAQVLDYIQKIREENESKLAEERMLLTEARELIAHLETKLSDLSGINAQLNDRLYSEQRHVGELNLTINKLNIEISGQRVELNERERINMDMKSQYSETMAENKRRKDVSKNSDRKRVV